MKPKKTPTVTAAASRYFAYLRVSTDDQNAANQKLGLLEYANAHGFAPLKIVEEIGSRAKSWRKRALADMLAEAQRGYVILSPEISRLGESALQVLDFMAKGVAVHITKHLTRDTRKLSMELAKNNLAGWYGRLVEQGTFPPSSAAKSPAPPPAPALRPRTAGAQPLSELLPGFDVQTPQRGRR
ncbi:recombinase family protein [Verminephrobacter eiseniae]|uniref:Resolvase, N-terminal domain n=1 Tax=Verminephrobacter eiseniae (strain EF01-2) TaxID=391735 RepID=A1WLT1_VEREI|nr:recombinase family protein [Verminephrobacter eiseniae]ABM58588.1 Resolvase, N-terminal domain [Verminephrobacter eiseniae EF01-2]MCW5284163.1 hypothetical protein [Verminephrobacter eiseniae]MCW5301871.1 hypothetical protein [Verminephrobacter eiseniae]MCW8182557.1 hypothetical protein [Verminephrobacter eiseniae]MCW8189641.1 hypothetical protein [Verminephrobacter eiseniae]